MEKRIKFKIFGWYVWLSREPMRVKNRSQIHRSQRPNISKRERLEAVGHRCEICGTPIDMSCRLFRHLPKGHPDRYAADNVQVMCGACFHRLEKEPHALGIKQLDRETPFDDSEPLPTSEAI